MGRGKEVNMRKNLGGSEGARGQKREPEVQESRNSDLQFKGHVNTY